jgi:hypothetical protein
MSLNILVTTVNFPGDLAPLLTAARRLRQRGHRVRILGDAADQADTMAEGFDGISWRRPLPLSPPDPASAD